MELPETEPPTSVELDRESGLRLVFPDGVDLRFGLDDLRRNCPCAECRGLRDQGVTPGRPDMRAENAELVGAWGLKISWNDGHETGIYAWSILRAWADV